VSELTGTSYQALTGTIRFNIRESAAGVVAASVAASAAHAGGWLAVTAVLGLQYATGWVKEREAVRDRHWKRGKWLGWSYAHLGALIVIKIDIYSGT
jgi:hypothetical protein